jgi:alanyl-tRNA synthetase
MLGNWSLGDYFKKDAIKMTFDFHTRVLKIPLERYAVTVFGGNDNSPKDEESEKIWLNLGIPKERIAFLENNWWETAGAGPCGPDTEMFYWKDNKTKAPKVFDPNDNRWVEIGNDVLMQFVKDEKGNYTSAKQKNVDFGGGVERTLAVLNGFDDNYLTEIWQPIIKEIEILSGKKYGKSDEETRSMRIIADHLKASVFIVGDGIVPSNSERGYVLRRLIRRAIRYGRFLGLREFTRKVCLKVFEIYKDYDNLMASQKCILDEIEKEETKFNLTLEQGMKVFEKLVSEEKSVDGKNAFLLYQSYGFPIEMTNELAKEAGIFVDNKRFEEESKKHQELSRTASAGTFKSGLADSSEETTRLHTTAHLLNEALRQVLDKEIKQKGSNINPERLRFDFNFARKVEPAELKKIEEWVNDKIKKKLEVKREEMKVEEAFKSGAHGEFGAKYPEIVSVYTIMDGKHIVSKEICTGPHVKNTSELGSFKILKEESSASGIRRIKAVCN